MMEYKIIVPGKLPNLNDYISACNSHYHAGHKMKKETEELIHWCAKKLIGKKFSRIFLIFCWIEPDKRRDHDNIAFAKKFILDALQKMGVLANDGWKQIAGFEDRFAVDASNPRVEITIRVLVDGESDLFGGGG